MRSLSKFDALKYSLASRRDFEYNKTGSITMKFDGMK